MFYTKEHHLYEIEQLMLQPPDYVSRGNRCIVTYKERTHSLGKQSPPSSYNKLLITTMKHVKHQPFNARLNNYIKESEARCMTYRNKKHKEIFEEMIREADENNLASLSALYLLTADYSLWKIMRNHISKNKIDFRDVKLNGISEGGYTLYCAAKDLYLGTKHITVCDLADKELISQKMFGLICNAMAIRRYGLCAIEVMGEIAPSE